MPEPEDVRRARNEARRDRAGDDRHGEGEAEADADPTSTGGARQDVVDRASIESFPASDSPGWIFSAPSHRAPGSAGGASTGSPTDPIAVVRRMFDAFQRGDISGILATVHSDTRWTYRGANPDPSRAVLQGPDEVRRFFERIFSRLDMEVFEPVEYVVDGSTVVVFGSEAGTVRATSQPFRNEWVQKYVIRDGLITTMLEFNIADDERT